VILIPVGHDHGELRRWPVISFAIMALCLGVWFVQYDGERGRAGVVREALQQAVEYYGANPDLHPSPALQKVSNQLSAPASAYLVQPEREQRRSADADQRARQEKLDQLTQTWQAAQRDNMVWHWGLIPADFSWLKLLTSMFVHIGFLHLFFNLLFLYLTAPFIEDVWGRPIFLAFYLVGGMFADGMFALQDLSLDLPLVGASGAVAAVMGAFLVRYPRAKIRLLTFLLWRRIVFSAPAWLVIGLWFLGEYAEAAASAGAIGSGGVRVANWAHVCGFVFGAGVAAAFRLLHLEDRYLFEAIERRREAVRDPLQARLDELTARGDNAEACRLLAAELLRRAGDAALAEQYWLLARGGAMKTQPSVCLRIIDNDLAQTRDELALDRWLELRHANPAAAPDVHLTVRLARRLSDHGRRVDAEEMLADCYRRLNASSLPQEWAELAEYCVSSGSAIAGPVSARAVSHPRLPPAVRDLLLQSQRLASSFV
jgi:membrane associated rhomboid family serine protease